MQATPTETTSSVLAQQDLATQWKQFKTSGVLDDAEYRAIEEYCRNQDPESRVEAILTTNVASTLLRLLTLHSVGAVKYVLALIDQAMLQRPAVGAKFAQPHTFLEILKNHALVNDKFIFWKTCRVLSFLFSVILEGSEHNAEVSQFISLLLANGLEGQQDAMLFSLKSLLRKSSIRALFVAANGVDRLHELLIQKDLAVQTQYQIVFCIWLLSFEKPLLAQIGFVIPSIVTVARHTQKEKVHRICFAALKNLGREVKNVEKMVESKLNKQLEIWSNRKWGDEDIVADLEELTTVVNRTLDEMSSFERYRAEVLSGDMEWTPVHFSESFWRDNISKLAEDDFRLVRLLSEHLSSSDSKNLTKAVACYDIGEFVRLHPAGRKVVSDLGTKKVIMALLYDTNTESEVQKQALLCTRKMMVSNWEMLGNMTK